MPESRMLQRKKWSNSPERRIMTKRPQSLKLCCTFFPKFLYVKAPNVSVEKGVLPFARAAIFPKARTDQVLSLNRDSLCLQG